MSMSTISIETRDSKAYITTPYSSVFVRRIRLMGGRWDSGSRRWVIPSEALPAARKLLMDIYGETDVAPAEETATVVVEYLHNVSAVRGAISIGGLTIARASGRDSGARLGPGVAFTCGQPQSGGSHMNWMTIIPAGCVVELYRVPLKKAQRLLRSNADEYKITYRREQPPKQPQESRQEPEPANDLQKLDRAALVAEKRRLYERLSEINRLLDSKKV